MSSSDSIDQSCLKFYHSLPKKPETTIRFFKRGQDFHTCYGIDAKLLAESVLNMPSLLRSFNESADSRICYPNISEVRYEVVLKKLLLVLHYRIEVYAADNARQWKRTIKASPGYLFQVEDIVYSATGQTNGEDAALISVKTKQVSGQMVVGMSTIDTNKRIIKWTEFVDNDQFSNLHSLLVQLDVGECLVPGGGSGGGGGGGAHNSTLDDSSLGLPDSQTSKSGSGSGSPLVKALSLAATLATECRSADFNADSVHQHLSRLLAEHSLGDILSATENGKVAMMSLSALLKYLEILGDDSNEGKFTLVKMRSCEFLRLDHSSVEALSLLPSKKTMNAGGNKSSTLFGLLNRCQTSGGKRLLSQWIRQPLLDLKALNGRLDVVETFSSNYELSNSMLECHLPKMPYFRALGRRLLRKTASLQDCYTVYSAVRALPALLEDLRSTSESKHSILIKDTFIQPLESLLLDFNKFCELIEATVDLERIANHREYIINPSFDDTLQDLRTDLDKLEKDVNVLFKKAAAELNLEVNKVIKLDSNNQHGFFYRITRKEEKCLRNNKRYTIVDTSKACVRFTESKLNSLNEDVLALRTQYAQQQASVVQMVVEVAAGYTASIDSTSNILSSLDVLTSFGHVVSNAPTAYVRPTLLPADKGEINFQGLRHCCLEVQDNISYIPNDVHFVKGQDEFHIITGPNMGGKSTHVRSAALAVILAQIGCFVPATSASLSPVDAVLTRIGAGDLQSKGVSTFMAEMLDTAAILKSATKNSLIIIDELGRGSSTFDGFGLAWAISEHIVRDIGCFTMFTTHFHELTSLADEYAAVSNYHVTAVTSDDTLTLLYLVQKGICDRSFGLHVAKLTDFPKRVIEYAEEKAKKMENFYSGDLKIKLEGEEFIKGFLDDYDKLEDKSQENIQLLKDAILSKNNDYVASLCTSAT